MIETGCQVADVARGLEINQGPLGSWVNQRKRDNPEREKVLSPMEHDGVAEMEK